MQKYDLKNIYEWPITTRALVIALICALVFYLGYVWDLSTVQKKLRANKQIEVDLKQQVILVVNKEKQIQNDISKLSGLETNLNEWQKKLINYHQLPELLNSILKLGANNQLEFNLFNPGQRSQANLYFKIPIKVVATGSYHQIASFISQIANMPWIVEINNFSIGRESKEAVLGVKLGNNPNTLILSLTLSVYYLPEGALK